MVFSKKKVKICIFLKVWKCAILLFQFFQDFMNSNVVTTVDTMTAPLSEVYFPSAVVCNINQVTWPVKLQTPRFIHQIRTSKPFRTPPKSLNFAPVLPEMGQTQAEIQKNRTLNPSKPRFIYQNWTTNPPEPSKNGHVICEW